MKKNFKKIIYEVIQVIWIAVLIGKISNWFFHYNELTNHILNSIMFSFLGVMYISAAWAFDKISIKIVLACCGIYIIIMNFTPEFYWKSIVGIICILTPMIIGRLQPEENNEEVSNLKQ